MSTLAALSAIYGDAARLQQITWNLLSNAVKFTPDGGSVGVQLRRPAARRIIVCRQRRWHSRRFPSLVFEPFRQADGSATRPHAGLGLGLSIVKQLVEAHGGTVRAEHREGGRGATFIVRLPIRDIVNRRPSPPDASGTAPQVQESLDGLSVLVVDDDEESRHVVAAHLEATTRR